MLRTDYKDDLFDGSRKYRMTDNGDGTVSFTDETEYIQQGDDYSAALVNEQNEAINTLLEMVYPVGSIYMSVNNVNPSTLFGGTWVAWGSGRVPVGIDTSDTSFNEVEKTGGEKNHTLTINEMPSHSHTYNSPYHSDYTGGYTGQTVHNWQSASTSPVGGSQAHNNLQPYITCYMWKRTA